MKLPTLCFVSGIGDGFVDPAVQYHAYGEVRRVDKPIVCFICF